MWGAEWAVPIGKHPNDRRQSTGCRQATPTANRTLFVYHHALTSGVMNATLHLVLSGLLKFGAVAIVFNELRGLILAAPVLYGLYLSGGTAMAIWLAFCSLAGIALSVIAPMFAVKRLDRLVKSKAPAQRSEAQV